MIRALKRTGYLLLIYSILILAGGLIGFITKKSIPSLVAGVFSGLTLLWTSILHFSQRKWGVYSAFILLFLLESTFSFRLIKTKAFFPSGMMLLLTSIVIVLMILFLIHPRQRAKKDM